MFISSPLLNSSRNRSITSITSPKASFISPRIDESRSAVTNKLMASSFKFAVVKVKLDERLKPDRAMDSIVCNSKMIIFGGKDNNL